VASAVNVAEISIFFLQFLIHATAMIIFYIILKHKNSIQIRKRNNEYNECFLQEDERMRRLYLN
jgi:hypothetical protein